MEDEKEIKYFWDLFLKITNEYKSEKIFKFISSCKLTTQNR